MQFHFRDYCLDVDRRELRRGAELLAVAPQVFDLLTYLVRNRERVVTKDDLIATIWGGRIVSESTLTSSINAVRKAVGDSGEQQSLVKTVARKGIRFVGVVTEGAARPPASTGMTARAPRQEVTFCKAADGVSLAVATSGSGLPVVKTGTWLTHIEHDWNSGLWEPLLTRLSAQFRLVRYDPRGCGLSDRDVAEFSFETLVDDIDAVVNSLELERFALFGFSQGAAMSIAYAARNPHRVSHLVLSGSYPRGWRRHDDGEIARREALIALIKHGWGLDNPAFRQVFSTRMFPDAPPEVMHWLNELQRVSTSAENAVHVQNAIADFDVTALLPKLPMPTLVLHSRGDGAVPFELGLSLARQIPNARFVEIDSRNHHPLSSEPAWPRYVEEICAFLAAHSPSHAAAASTP
jgi:pimeloyl-ACP methyl ester carboxylesterase/DNA-binding winged helix-turn-helix (wHTH) protein